VPGIPAGPAKASRGRIIGARVLVVVGILLTLISVLSNFVKREALDADAFKQTSQELIASPAIQEQVAAAVVRALYGNVDVSAELRDQLPSNLQGLAGLIAGLSPELADRAAREILSRPGAQATFVELASASQAQFVKVLHGGTAAVSTSNGNVVVDLRPLVLKLGDRFMFVSNLADKVPQGSAQFTVLRSEDLKTAQNITHLLEQVANWIWILAVAAWAAAIWLARGRRRQEVRALGVGLVLVGILVLVVRSLAGTYFVDHLVVSESVRPAASDAWQIITRSLADSGWVGVCVGALVALGAWLTGPGARATAARTGIAPALKRSELAWGLFSLGIVVIVWILPIQMFQTTVILVVAAAIGFVVLRRQVVAEAPAAAGSAAVGAVPGDTSSPADEL